jgi:hypothetical protein
VLACNQYPLTTRASRLQYIRDSDELHCNLDARDVKSRKVTIAHRMSEVEVTTLARERSCLFEVLFGYQGGTIVEPRPDALPALCRIRPVMSEEIAKREIACMCIYLGREQPQHSTCLQEVHTRLQLIPRQTIMLTDTHAAMSFKTTCAEAMTNSALRRYGRTCSTHKS